VLDESLCGEAPGPKTLDLSLPVVQGSRIASSSPGLASWITKAHSRAIYFLENGEISDEDLSVLPGNPEILSFVRDLCKSPVPRGRPGVLYLLSKAAETDKTVRQVFIDLGTLVADFESPSGDMTRLTASRGELRVYSGIRYQRVAHNRKPELLIRASAAEL